MAYTPVDIQKSAIGMVSIDFWSLVESRESKIISVLHRNKAHMKMGVQYSPAVCFISQLAREVDAAKAIRNLITCPTA
jgi:hypothetical protein